MDVAAEPVDRESEEREDLRYGAENILDTKRPEAAEYWDRHGKLRLALIPESTRAVQPRDLQALKLGGFNIRRYPRSAYEEQLQPPEYAR